MFLSPHFNAEEGIRMGLIMTGENQANERLANLEDVSDLEHFIGEVE